RLADVRPDLDWPPALEQLVHRALAKDPDARPASMEDFQRELESAQWDQDKVTRAVQSIEELPAMINQRHRELDTVHPDTLGEVVSSQLAARRRAPEEAAARMEEVRALFPAAVQESTKTMPRARVTVPVHVRLIGLLQGFMPWLLTAALAGGLFWVISNDAKVAAILSGLTGGKEDAQALFAEGKLAKARSVLEKKDADGSLSPAEFELLNKIYVRLAEQEAGARHYQNAITLLQKVPSKSSQYEKAKSLIKKYRRLH